MVLSEFPPLTVWRAGLVLGSIIHFEIGDRIWQEAFKGQFQIGGTAYLSLYGDDWWLKKNGEVLISSSDVTRELFEGGIAPMFPNVDLVGFRLVQPDVIRIEFSAGLTVDCRVPKSAEKCQEDLIYLHVPDGRIYRFRPSDGFYLTDETDTDLAMHWAARRPGD